MGKFTVYINPNPPNDEPNKGLIEYIASTERELEAETCLDDDEEFINTELYYNEVVSKKRICEVL